MPHFALRESEMRSMLPRRTSSGVGGCFFPCPRSSAGMLRYRSCRRSIYDFNGGKHRQSDNDFRFPGGLKSFEFEILFEASSHSDSSIFADDPSIPLSLAQLFGA